MSDEEIMGKLIEIFQLMNDKNVDVSQITMESNLSSIFGLDSVGLIYMAIAIEKNFDIDMSDVKVNTFQTVANIVNFIKERLNCN